MRLFSETRSAKAAVAVWFVLACTAMVGITEIASHGRAAAQDAINLSQADKPSHPRTAGAKAVVLRVADRRSPQSP